MKPSHTFLNKTLFFPREGILAIGDLHLGYDQMLKNQGGGELITKGLDGKIRSKDTIPPGNDPNPPKDKEH